MAKYKVTLEKIRSNREASKLVPKTFRLHPQLEKAFNQQVIAEGSKQVHLIERALVYYLNHGGEGTKIP